MPLYHYTCEEHHEAIKRDRLLKPGILVASKAGRDRLRRTRISRITSQLVWLTTVPHITYLNAGIAGLYTEQMAALVGVKPCNRTAFRWELTDDKVLIQPWTVLRERWPADIVDELESFPQAQPKTWWVTRGPAKASYSPNHAVRESVPIQSSA